MSKRREESYYDRTILNYFKKTCSLTCCYCNKKLKRISNNTVKLNSLTVDHYIPIAKGGTTVFDNLRSCCYQCNLKKDDITGDEYIENLDNYSNEDKYLLEIKSITSLLPLDKIKISYMYKNTIPNDLKIKTIINYIKIYNIIDKPILVKSSNNQLLGGYTRYIAALQLEITNVPVEILQEINMKKIVMINSMVNSMVR